MYMYGDRVIEIQNERGEDREIERQGKDREKNREREKEKK